MKRTHAGDGPVSRDDSPSDDGHVPVWSRWYTPRHDEDDDTWRERQCHALYHNVREQLKCSWTADGLCDVVACKNVTGRFLPYVNGRPQNTMPQYSDSYGARKDRGEGGSIPLSESMRLSDSMRDPECGPSIVVCSPACYLRAKRLTQSSPTLFGSFGPILRGCPRVNIPWHLNTTPPPSVIRPVEPLTPETVDPQRSAEEPEFIKSVEEPPTQVQSHADAVPIAPLPALTCVSSHSSLESINTAWDWAEHEDP